MTLTDHPTDETIDSIEIIEKLAEKLKRMTGTALLEVSGLYYESFAVVFYDQGPMLLNLSVIYGLS